jgi:hypothetical protein
MTLVQRIRWFLQPPIRLGEDVELEREEVAELSSRAKFPANEELERRIEQARARINGAVVEDNPDTFLRPAHVPEDVQ